MRLLLKRSTTKKENSITYYANIWERADSIAENNDTGETIFDSRAAVFGDLNSLSAADTQVYEQLLLGSPIAKMEAEFAATEGAIKLTRIQIVGAINRIATMVAKRQE